MGCVGYVHQHQEKLKARAARCMFVGFLKGGKGFKMWHPIERKFTVSRDITFRENEMFMHKESMSDDKTEISNSKIEVERLIEPPTMPNTHSESEDDEETTEEQPETIDAQLDMSQYKENYCSSSQVSKQKLHESCVECHCGS